MPPNFISAFPALCNLTARPTVKPTDEELRKLQAQFRSLKVSHGGTVAERLNREAFHHNFAKKLKPQFIDKIFKYEREQPRTHRMRLTLARSALDWDHSGVVSFREFVMLTHVLFAGTEDEKIDCAGTLISIITRHFYPPPPPPLTSPRRLVRAVRHQRRWLPLWPRDRAPRTRLLRRAALAPKIARPGEAVATPHYTRREGGRGEGAFTSV